MIVSIMPALTLSVPSSARTCQSSPRHSRSTSGRKTLHSSYSIHSLRPTRSLLSSQFDRNAQRSFEAAINVEQLRSSSYVPNQQHSELTSVWQVQPPDFRPQVYRPQPPKRNSRDSIQPWTYQAQYEQNSANEVPSQARASAGLQLPSLREQQEKEDTSESQDVAFITRFKNQHTVDEKVNVIRTRQLPLQKPYKNPKPHDFRGYPDIKSLGLEEFSAPVDHDPYNLHFLSEHLGVVHGLSSTPPRDCRYEGIQMVPVVQEQPKWEARLILPKTMWPNRPAYYTRFRRLDRTAHSAFMERVEDILLKQWSTT